MLLIAHTCNMYMNVLIFISPSPPLHVLRLGRVPHLPHLCYGYATIIVQVLWYLSKAVLPAIVNNFFLVASINVIDKST